MRLALVAALALAITLPVAAQQRHKPASPALQPPFPGTAKARQPPQHEGGATQEAAHPEQRGSEERPVIVKVLPAEKTAEERAQEAADRSDKSSADWWLVRFYAGES
jgi:hypothetical protein